MSDADGAGVPGAPHARVSVVIPTRNRRQRLVVTLEGVRRQTIRDLEVLVVDDGSIDGTSDVVAGLGDPRIRVVRHEAPRGVAAARNAGIASSRARWIAFLDDDDLWAPEKLERQLDALESTGADIAWTAAAYVGPDGQPFQIAWGPPAHELALHLRGRNTMPAGASNVVVRASLLATTGGFDEQLMHFADWDLWARLAPRGRAVAIPETLVAYVAHGSNMRSAQAERFEDELRVVDSRHGGRPSSDPDRAALLRWMADGHASAGDRVGAARIYARVALAQRNIGDLRRCLVAIAGGEPGRPKDGFWAGPAMIARLSVPDWLVEYPGFPIRESAGGGRSGASRRTRLKRWFRVMHGTLSARLCGRRVGLAIVYHRLGAGAEPERSGLDPPLSAEEFARHLRYMARHYKLVPASELFVSAAGRRRGQRLPLAITFDDDLRSHVTISAAVLRAHRAPATFFLSGGSLKQPFSYWWERFDRAVANGMPLDAPILPSTSEAAEVVRAWGGTDIDAIGEAIRRLSPSQRDSVAEDLLSFAGPDPAEAGLRERHVRELVQQGFEIGFHTLRHDSLDALTDDALLCALTDNRDALSAICGHPIKLIAYPHGAADARVASAAAREGYLLGMTTRAIATDASTSPLLVGRIDAGRRSCLDLADILATVSHRPHSTRGDSNPVLSARSFGPDSIA